MSTPEKGAARAPGDGVGWTGQCGCGFLVENQLGRVEGRGRGGVRWSASGGKEGTGLYRTAAAGEK